MTASTSDRNLGTLAQMRLDNLAKCEGIQPYRATDDELVCANAGFEVEVSPTNGWVHSGAEVRAMQRLVEEGSR